MIGVAQPDELLRLDFRFEHGCEDGRLPDSIRASLSADDNPVLFFYEFSDLSEISDG